MKRLYVLAVLMTLAFVVFMCGCQPVNPDKVPNSIPAAGSAMDQTTAYISTAEMAVQAAKGHADAVGKEDLALASTSHKSAQGSVVEAKKSLAATATERDSLKTIATTAQAGQVKLLHSWGYRFQVIVTRFAILLAVLFGLHLLMGGLSLVLPMFFPMTAVAVPIIKTVGAVVNPLAWFQFVVDHLHLTNCTARVAAILAPPVVV